MSNPILKKEDDPKRGYRSYAYFDVGGKKQKVRFGKWGDGKEPLPEAQEKFNRTSELKCKKKPQEM